ncbi:MAG: hypothetical protein ACSHXK_06885 [Oceanococcus sp.]
MNEQDEQWFDALAGHCRPANAQDQRLQQALRQAANIDAAAQRDQLAERRLLDRLEREGFLASASEPQQTKRMIWPRLAQVAVIVLCLGLLVELSLMPTLQREEGRMPFSSKDAPERPVQALASAPKVQAAAESIGLSKAPQALMQAQGAMTKPVLEESSSVELADQAAPTVSRQSNSAFRSAKSPPLKREREQVLELWVEDLALASQHLEAWRIEMETDSSAKSELAGDGLMQLRCDKEAACKGLEDALLTLSMRPWSTTPSVGQAMQLRLRQTP